MGLSVWSWQSSFDSQQLRNRNFSDYFCNITDFFTVHLQVLEVKDFQFIRTFNYAVLLLRPKIWLGYLEKHRFEDWRVVLGHIQELISSGNPWSSEHTVCFCSDVFVLMFMPHVVTVCNFTLSAGQKGTHFGNWLVAVVASCYSTTLEFSELYGMNYFFMRWLILYTCGNKT